MQSKSTITVSVNDNRNVDRGMDESVFEQICDTIFTLIPEVPRLKQLFLSWCQLSVEERAQLDAKVRIWYNPNRRQLYKPLREALIRWENVQDTQGAPGCEAGMVSFSCDPQLEEELVNVICSLEVLFLKARENKDDYADCEIGCFMDLMNETLLTINEENSYDSTSSPKDKIPHSVHSCSYIMEHQNSDDELSGYITN